MRDRSEIAAIKAGLQARIEEVCRRLLPHGRRDGPHWAAYNPFVAGDERKDPALKVGLKADPGAWRDWRNGDKGDVIDLIAFANRTDRAGALKWARDFLGLQSMSREERAKMERDARLAEKRRAEKAVKDRAFKLVEADRLFNRASRIGEGGAAERHARAYFKARGCALDDVPHLNPYSFRFSGASEWWKGAKWETADGRRFKSEAGPEFPAVHSAMRGATGAVACCHVTFLDPIQPAKAPVTPPKLMFGEALGTAIEVACGPAAKPFWMAETAAPLIIAEGIETALSLAIAIPEARVWAAGSLAGIGAAPVALDCVAAVTVARDNNFGNDQAQAQLDRALEALARTGKRVDVMASHVGDDFNDLMQGVD